MAPADNTPDFDSMSPEEIMAFMETLARRQGVKDEELTTKADLDIPEVDPDTAVIDEPGYVPYGEERPEKPAAPRTVERPAAQPQQPAAPPTKPQQPAAGQPRPPERTTTPPTGAPQPPRPLSGPQVPPPRPPVFGHPPEQPEPRPVAPTEPEPPKREEGRGWRMEPVELPRDNEAEQLMAETQVSGGGGEADPMAWLESLAADQGDTLFNIDLEALSAEIDTSSHETQVSSSRDPVEWLQNLSQNQGEPESERAAAEPPPAQPAQPAAKAEPEEAQEGEVPDPFRANVDPMTWLETLARRQGARDEELTTSTQLNIPTPENPVIDEPGYKAFSFDAPPEPRRPAQPEPEPESLELEDPSAWLSSLSAGEGFEEGSVTGKPQEAPAEEPSLELDDIEEAIARGEVTSEQMQFYLEQQTDRLVEEWAQPEPDFDPDAPPVPAELPDWLLEQVGAPPASSAETEAAPPAAEQPPLVDMIVEPPEATDIPDWLREDVDASDSFDFESIFADEGEDEEATPEPKRAEALGDAVPSFALDIDPDDPWVEAFDLEYESGQADINAVPEWYAQNLSNPDRVEMVERLASGAASEMLMEANLPAESVLPAGEAQALPAWLHGTLPMETAEAESVEPFETIEQDIPDWLREVEAANVEAENIPDWLTESMDEGEPYQDVFAAEAEAAAEAEREPMPEPAPVMQTPPSPPPTPTPTPAPQPVSGDAATVLEAARARVESGEVDASLTEYETLIRMNTALDAVVEDLSRLVKVERKNPSLYRVLGDGLMRQGNLQAALDTYREALNLL